MFAQPTCDRRKCPGVGVLLPLPAAEAKQQGWGGWPWRSKFDAKDSWRTANFGTSTIAILLSPRRNYFRSLMSFDK